METNPAVEPSPWSECPVTFRMLCILLILALLAPSAAPAKSPKALAAENAELKARLEALEAELGEIKSMLKERAAADAKAAEAKAAAKPAGEKPAVRAKFDTELYGYVKVDASYDTNRFNTGNYSAWVLPTTKIDAGQDNEFTLTGRQTRLGMNVKGPDTFRGAKTSANVEVDFYGAAGATEAKPNLRLRHAFMEFNWADLDLKLKAGNTSDIIAPLNPATVDFVVRWWAGNPGERHPQIALTKGFKLDGTHRFDLTVGATRTQGNTNTVVANNADSGQESGQPTVQSRLAYTFPGFHGLKSVLGLSGLMGRDEYDVANNDEAYYFKSRGLFADLDLPLHELWRLSGEWFKGTNLDDVNAGIGQGMVVRGGAVAATPFAAAIAARNYVNPATMGAVPVLDLETIDTTGGWLQLNFNPAGPFDCNVGYSRDRVSTDRLLLPAGTRRGNYAAWVNMFYDLGKNSQFALEYSRWLTQYKAGADANARRLQSSFIYKF